MCRGFNQMLNQRLSSVEAEIVCSLFPLDFDPPTGRGPGRHPNVDCTCGAADSASLKGLDTAIATRIAAGDTTIKVVHLLSRCVDESGNTQALYCMDKDVLVDVLHQTWTRAGFTLLCTVMQKEACGLSRGGKSGVSETFVCLDTTFDELQCSVLVFAWYCWCLHGIVCVCVCVVLCICILVLLCICILVYV